MALRWLLHSACTIVYGKPNPKVVETNKIVSVEYPNNDDNNEEKAAAATSVNKRLKLSKDDGVAAVLPPPPQVERATSSTSGGCFQMPLHYPRYSKADYQKMEEWKVDMLLQQYGLSFEGSLDDKRAYAMGTFLWPHQL